MIVRPRHVALSLAVLALAGCQPTAQSTAGGPATPAASASVGVASPAAATTPRDTAPSTAATGSPAAAGSQAPATPAGTAPPAQAEAGQAEAQAAADAMADERRLAAYDLLADGGTSAQRRIMQATETEAKDAAVAVELTEAGRAAAAQRRAELRTAGGAKLAALDDAKAVIQAALAKATDVARTGGGVIKAADATLADGTTLRLVRGADKGGTLLYASVRATAKAGDRTFTRTRTLRPDGGATVVFSRKLKAGNGSELSTSWARSEAADGTLTGSGVITMAGADGKPRVLQVSLAGTHGAPTLTLKDAAAQLQAEVSLPFGGAPTAALLRLDAGEARHPLTVTAD